MNVGKILFAQVMEHVPWKTLGSIIDRHKGNAGVRTLGSADFFRIMAWPQLTWRESLRDIEACPAANQAKLFHMGLTTAPARSTLADALNQRDWRIYHTLAQHMVARARALYAQQPSVRDLRGAIPAFIQINDGKLQDVNVLDILPTVAGAFFVTRAKVVMDARRVYSAAADHASGVICDQHIMLNGFYSAQHYPEHLRRVRFKYPETGKALVLLTNNTSLPALTIAALYKSHWQIDLFFKWIKQHLRIKRSLGSSENAVKTQTRRAVSAYVLIAIVKKEFLNIDSTFKKDIHAHTEIGTTKTHRGVRATAKAKKQIH